jgi:hypothetical protein
MADKTPDEAPHPALGGSVREAAARFGIPLSRMRRLVAFGLVPSYCVAGFGRRYVFYAEVEAAIREGKVRPPGPDFSGEWS